MADFFNVFGSILLVSAGISVLIGFFKEKQEPNKRKKSKINKAAPAILNTKKIDFQKWIYIALAALIARWLIYLVGYWINDPAVPFWEQIVKVFSVSGDSPHYLYLAEHGYTAVGDQAKLIVFYPLYPLCIKIFNVFFNNYLISGIVVSNLAFMASCCVFYELLRLDYSEKQAIGGLCLMIAAPFTMFYSAVFTESVFLLTTVLCLYFLRTKKPMWMAICGFLACLSRTQGVLLFLCAFVMVAKDLWQKRKLNTTLLLWSLLIPVGFFVYLLMNKLLFGNWFQYLQFQAAEPWYNKAQWFGKTLSYSYNMAHSYPGLANFIYLPQLILFFIGTLSIFYGVYKKVRTEYLVYLGAYIFTCYTHGWLISGSRYMCACLPLYIVFASVKNKYVRYAVVAVSLILCLIYTGLWLRGESIM